jgi:hypothetical protein
MVVGSARATPRTIRFGSRITSPSPASTSPDRTPRVVRKARGVAASYGLVRLRVHTVQVRKGATRQPPARRPSPCQHRPRSDAPPGPASERCAEATLNVHQALAYPLPGGGAPAILALAPFGTRTLRAGKRGRDHDRSER